MKNDLVLPNDPVYIYALSDPLDEKIYYVGKAKDVNKRLNQHLKDKSMSCKVNWLNNLLSLNTKPNAIILEVSDETNWKKAERKWIDYGIKNKWPLTNLTDGGEGWSANLQCNAIIEKYYSMGYWQESIDDLLGYSVKKKTALIIEAGKKAMDEIVPIFRQWKAELNRD